MKKIARVQTRQKINMPVICEEDISDEILWDYFHNRQETIIYVTDRDEVLTGIITRGDYYRFVSRNDALVNRRFTKVVESNISKAYKILRENEKIHAIPLTDSAGRIFKECYQEKRDHSRQRDMSFFMELYDQTLKGVEDYYDIIVFLADPGLSYQPVCDKIKVLTEVSLGELIRWSENNRFIAISFRSDMNLLYKAVSGRYSIPIDINERDRQALEASMNQLCLLSDLFESVGIFWYDSQIWEDIFKYHKHSVLIRKEQVKCKDSLCKLINMEEIPEVIISVNCPFGEPWGRIKQKSIPIFAVNYRISTLEYYDSMENKVSDMDIAVNVIPRLKQHGISCLVLQNIDTEYGQFVSMLPEDIRHRGSVLESRDQIVNMMAGDGQGGSLEGQIYDEFYGNQRWVRENGFLHMSDIRGEYVTIIREERYTVGNPEEYDRKLFLFGPCVFRGDFVEDKYSIGSLLRGYIPMEYYIKNCVTGFGNMSFAMRMQTYHKGDLVILMANHAEPYERNGIKVYSIADAYRRIPHLENHVWDTLSHCNKVVTASIAKQIGILCRQQDIFFAVSTSSSQELRFMFPSDVRVPKGLREWLDSVAQYKTTSTGKKGAIVMNCNPFSRGHRYLVEEARKQVDVLYLFILEEDKSFFRFEDRIEMVRLGTKDLENIIVIPSGRYIISTDTLPGYFDKENNPTVEFDATDDLEYFAKVIAKEFDIQVRFAGSEPKDIFTCKYNNYMRKLLPRYGLEFCEIERKTLAGGEVISASLIRKCMKEGAYEKIRELVLPPVYDYLQDHYLS